MPRAKLAILVEAADSLLDFVAHCDKQTPGIRPTVDRATLEQYLEHLQYGLRDKREAEPCYLVLSRRELLSALQTLDAARAPHDMKMSDTVVLDCQMHIDTRDGYQVAHPKPRLP